MPPKVNNKSGPKLKYILLSIFVLLAVATSWLAVNKQTVKDWYLLANYKAPSSISRFVKVDGMKTYARNLFYINRPQLDYKQQFAQYCPNTSSQTYVLGCYHSGDKGIYLLKISNPKLKGINSVTAAYEMLHAGYERLSYSTRQTIDNQMWQFYTLHVSQPQIHQQMAAYAATEPGARYEELYSVLGTEVGGLPASLEQHYQVYFSNRAQIVAMYNGYESAFTTRLNQIKNYDSQLSALKASIAQGESYLTTTTAMLSNIKQTMNRELTQGDTNAYNNSVVQFNGLVIGYNGMVKTITNQINTYNQLVNQRNQLSIEEQQLVKSIDSKPTPQLQS